MDWASVFIVIAFLALIGSVIVYFMVEGFQNRMTQAEADARMGPQADTVCMAQKSCGKCLDDKSHPGTQCGWCPAAQACIPRSGMYRLIPSWLMDIIKLDATKDCIASEFKYAKGQCMDDTCSDYKNCKDCAGALACGWCTTSNKCFSKAAVAARGSGGSGGSGGSESEPLCATTVVTQSGTCPPPICTDITDCGTCTQTTGCGYCRDSKKCLPVDANQVGAAGGSSGSSGCAQGSFFTKVFQCPCAGLSVCTDCAARPGCGYCVKSSTCVDMYQDRNRDGVFFPKVSDCAEEGVATSASQCTPGAQLGNVRSEKNKYNTGPGEYKPSLDELNLAQDNTALGGKELNVAGSYGGATGAGDSPVSPAKTYTTLSGNGVVTPANPLSYGITNTPDLSSPVESYVKLLVRSELASQGIPTNEPFQVNEGDALGNAGAYLEKSAKRVLHE